MEDRRYERKRGRGGGGGMGFFAGGFGGSFGGGYGGGFGGMERKRDPKMEGKPKGGWTGKPVSWQVQSTSSFQAPTEIDPVFEDLGDVSTGPSTPVT